MSKVRVANFAISIEGYSSAPGQTRKEPFGPGGLRVMEWFFPTDTFQKMQKKSGETGIDNDFSAERDQPDVSQSPDLHRISLLGRQRRLAFHKRIVPLQVHGLHLQLLLPTLAGLRSDKGEIHSSVRSPR